MADKTGIEWCDASWHPLVGCVHASRGCENCWAERVAARFRNERKEWAKATDENNRWTGTVVTAASQLLKPLHWKRPRRIFALGMTDFCFSRVSSAQLSAVGKIIRAAPQHTYILLTKRPTRLREAVQEMFDEPKAPSNVWIGVSIESQDMADQRIPALIEADVTSTPFVSCEPLLGPIDLSPWLQFGRTNPAMDESGYNMIPGTPGKSLLSWIVVGCESGPGANLRNNLTPSLRRQIFDGWAFDLMAQSTRAGVPFFYKQAPLGKGVEKLPLLQERQWTEYPGKEKP